jgi:hypothetical protein
MTESTTNYSCRIIAGNPDYLAWIAAQTEGRSLPDRAANADRARGVAELSRI